MLHISWLVCGKQTYYGKLKFSIRQPKIFVGVRDQSLLMPGRGPEEILRGHQKFLSSEGGVRK
jgi:hypothetical protein